MSVIEEAEKWLWKTRSTNPEALQQGMHDGADVIKSLIKEMEKYKSMKFNVGELLSAVTEAHKADALFELKHDYEGLNQLKEE